MNGRRILILANAIFRTVRDMAVALVALLFFGITFVLPQRIIVRATGFLARVIGMRMPQLYRNGMHNLALAFPEKTPAEHRAILRQSWDNMGRTAAEYFFIKQIWDFDPAARQPGQIEISGEEIFIRLASDNKPAIILAAHLANWELPMIAAERHGLDATALYARPRNRWIAGMVTARRQSSMNSLVMSGPGALQRLARALEAGSHLGLLIDQYFIGGPVINMFGHSTAANPIFARLARLFECPVHMVRVIRLPGDRFRVELGEELILPRDGNGRVDITASLQMAANVIEGWVREHPEQWLWVHRRWR